MLRRIFKQPLQIVPAIILLALPVVSFAAAVEPSLAPQVSSVFPHGGRRGAAFDVKISGTNLERAARIEFTPAAVRARITESKARQILAHVEIDAQAEPGPCELRVFTSSGTALGVFVVSTLPEMNEAEPNDRVASAQEIHYPLVINGTAGAEDADLFRFEAHAGQTLAFDIAAARNGSPLDPVLAVLDANGREIAYCDDYYIEKDAHLEHTFQREGTYFVRVTASYSRSAPGADYRLAVSDRAYPMYSIPAGARRGSSLRLTIRGSNLDALDQVRLDTQALHSSVVKRSNKEFIVNVDIPANVLPGRHRLHFSVGQEDGGNPLSFEISDSPEVTVDDATAIQPDRPVRIASPVVVNAEIAEHGSDYLHRVHTYEFEAPENGRYEFQVRAWDMGLRTDPVVTLFDPEGNKIAMEDDPAPNSFIHYAGTHDPDLVYKFPKAGRYRVSVRDVMYRGGPGFIYRLTVRPVLPDYHVAVLAPQLTAFVGRKAELSAKVQRTGGVHIIETFKHPDNEIANFRIKELDGWQSPVILHAEGLPRGVTADSVLAEPRNTAFKGNDGEDLFVDGTVVQISFQVNSEAQPGTYKIHIRAESSFDGRKVAREARVFRKNRLLKVPSDEENTVYLTIVKPPPLLVTAPEHLEIARGETGHLKVNIYYFEQQRGPVSIEARTQSKQLEMAAVPLPARAEELEIPFSASLDAKGSIDVVLIARDAQSGLVLSESAPVTVRISTEAVRQAAN